MSESVLLVQTNRANSVLNLSIATAFCAALIFFTIHHVATSTYPPETPNQWVSALFDNAVLILITAVPIAILVRVIAFHVRVVATGYIAILNSAGIRVITNGRPQIFRWSDLEELRIDDRVLSIGVDRSIRPGQRRIHRTRVSLKYSSVTNAEVLRFVGSERPDLLTPNVRRGD